HLCIKLFAARASETGKISRGPLSETQRPHAAYPSIARTSTGIAGIDRCRIESGSAKRGQKHHGDSPGSDGKAASPQVARKPSGVKSHSANHDTVLHQFGDPAGAHRFSS